MCAGEKRGQLRRPVNGSNVGGKSEQTLSKERKHLADAGLVEKVKGKKGFWRLSNRLREDVDESLRFVKTGDGNVGAGPTNKEEADAA
jgi:hypothetical protein